MTQKNSKRSLFGAINKSSLAAGQEISDGELIWRKLKDGSGTWRYDFKISGQRFKGTLGQERNGVTLSQARSEYQRIRAEAYLNSPRKTGSCARRSLIEQCFEDAADGFLEWSAAHHLDYRHNVSRMEVHLRPHFSGRRLSAITAGDVEEFRVYLLRDKRLSPKTIRRIVSLLSNVFEYVRQCDSSVGNPTRQLKSLRTEPEVIEIFTDEELGQLLNPDNNPSLCDRAMVALGCYAGLRASEVLGLQWKNVDLQQCVLHIRQSALEGKVRVTTKNGKSRCVPISKSLQPILSELKCLAIADGHSQLGSAWLFPSDNPEKPVYQVQNAFRRQKRNAQLTDSRGFHALRHTFATRALDHQVPVHALKEWMGHSSIRMTEHYVHFLGGQSIQMAKYLP